MRRIIIIDLSSSTNTWIFKGGAGQSKLEVNKQRKLLSPGSTLSQARHGSTCPVVYFIR